MKKVLLFVLGISFLGFMSSCGDDETGTNISISGIPATATVKQGETLTVSGVSLTADAGIAAFAVTVDGGNPVNLSSLITVGETSATVTIEFSTTDLAIGNRILVFTLTDAAGQTTAATHVLAVEDPAPQVLKTGLIDANETWTADNIYILSGRVVVDAGVTLTIEPGTIVKGEEGDGSLASALIVARGGKIMADGTADNPIIFTSVLDNITVGQTAGTNLTFEDNGLWGGIIILGNAPISADAASVQIEGIPADDTFGLYGGDVANDNSGKLNYVSIRHGGTLIGEGNEINGLTLGGVGSGTTISNIEIVANKDDGIEWFGGTVNVTNALVYAADDDGIDIDQAYSGTINNFIVIAFAGTDHALEIDGPEGAAMGKFTLSNGTIKGFDDEMADFRDGAMGTVQDVYFFNFPNPATTSGEGDLELDAGDLNDDDSNSVNYQNGDLVITGCEFNPPAGLTMSDIVSDKFSANNAAFQAQMAIDNSIVSTPTVGADATVFAWTYTSQSGALAGL